MAKKNVKPTSAKSPTKSFSINQLSNLIDKISDETKIIIQNDDKQECISTSVYILNALLSKSIRDGGVSADRITIFAGEPNTGKSYVLYNVARNAQKQGFYVLFIDTEHSVSKDSLKNFGIDSSPDKLKLISSNNIEDLKFFLTKFLDGLKAEKMAGSEIPKVIIFLDSIGQLASEKEKADALEGKTKQDMTRAKAIKQLFRIINSDLGYLRIPMIATNHTYDTTDFFPQQVMSGGKGAEYSASTIIFLSVAQLKTGNEDELDLNSSGVIVTAKAKKNRMAKPKKIKFEINHSYGTNPFKGLEYFCTSENFEKVGIAKGKPIKDESGKVIGITGGGNYWYVRHLDKSMFEKQLFTKEVFNEETLEALEPIIYKYFDYSSFEEQQMYIDKMETDTTEESQDVDFDVIDEDDLFA
jgi:RecA/RadA recombinase